MKHNTFMEVFNKLAPWLSSRNMQSLFTLLQTLTKSDNDEPAWSLGLNCMKCFRDVWRVIIMMMTPNNYTTSPTPTASTRKETHTTLSKTSQSAAVQGAAGYLAGEDPTRLEQDKRAIYK